MMEKSVVNSVSKPEGYSFSCGSLIDVFSVVVVVTEMVPKKYF